MPALTIAAAPSDYICLVCGTGISEAGLCTTCQSMMDARDAAEHAARTRALAADSITEALRLYLDKLTAEDLRLAEHRAQIRLANAEQGSLRTRQRVESGIYGQVSLDAANDEIEAARAFLGLVHEAQSVEVRRQQEAEVAWLATACPGCESSDATGPLCDECKAEQGGEQA
ncbi:hypothetical protein ACIODS_12510 [Micromonospora chalcea]|uniref:hypothetical protein n=1 Tax=Micromonospora chalcea TaxID=1874 RepID=UPI0037F91B7A